MAAGTASKPHFEQTFTVPQLNKQHHQKSLPPFTLKAFTNQRDEFPPLTMPAPTQTTKLSFVEAVKCHPSRLETTESAHVQTSPDFAAEKLDPDSVDILPISEHQGKPAVFFPIAHKENLVDKLKFVLVGKFSHGRPIWNNVKKFFNDLQLKGDYKVSVLDNKHIFIVCSCKSDFDRLWLKFSWSVSGVPMRVFKWGPDFSPLKETSIQPIWIRMVGLPLHLIDEMSLLQISHIFGKPIKVDSRNINQFMLNQARVCVQLDVDKPLIDSCWIGFKNEAGEIVESHYVQAFYDFVPAYCSFCAHIGHKMEECKRKFPTIAHPDVIEEVRDVMDVDKAPEIVHQRSGKEHSNNLVWQPVATKNKDLQPNVEQRRETGASSSANVIHRNCEQEWQLIVSKKNKTAKGKTSIADQGRPILLQSSENSGQKLQKMLSQKRGKQIVEVICNNVEVVPDIVVHQTLWESMQIDTESSSKALVEHQQHELEQVLTANNIEPVGVFNDDQELRSKPISWADQSEETEGKDEIMDNSSGVQPPFELSDAKAIVVWEGQDAVAATTSFAAEELVSTPVRGQIEDCSDGNLQNIAAIAYALKGKAEASSTQADSEEGIVRELNTDFLVEAEAEQQYAELIQPISMEDITGTRSTFDRSENAQLTDSSSSGLEDTSDWQKVTRNRNKRPIKTQARTTMAIVVSEDADEPGETTVSKKAELQVVVVPNKSEADNQATPTRSKADHQPFTPSRSTIAQVDSTFQEPTPTNERQYVGQKNNKVQGAVTRAQTYTSNYTWADQVEEEQLATLSRKQLDRKISKVASRLNNMGLKHALRGQLLAEMEVLTQHFTKRFPPKESKAYQY